MPEKGHRSYSDDEKRRKRLKWAAYITAFIIFQTMVILVFVLVVMKVRTPKFRVDTPTIHSISNSTNGSSATFDMKMLLPIRIKSNNFGPYKYDATTVDFTNGTVVVGNVSLPKSKVGFMSTKKIDSEVELNFPMTPSFESELNAGVLTVESTGKMNGKVEMMWIFKKKKAIQIECIIQINVRSLFVELVTCK